MVLRSTKYYYIQKKVTLLALLEFQIEFEYRTNPNISNPTIVIMS